MTVTPRRRPLLLTFALSCFTATAFTGDRSTSLHHRSSDQITKRRSFARFARARGDADQSRRDVLRAAKSAAVASAFVPPALAFDENTETVDVYFGCGCFWHVQHEFVEAERRLLGRTVPTARAGYAGGRSGADADGRVCYHNALRVADYGSLGHAEVVSLRDVPTSKFTDLAAEYFRLFDDKGDRPDQFGDRGPEYRNVVGLPGGADSPLAKELVETSKRTGDRLDFARGKGDDPDARAVVFVVDSNRFPFFVAERYHQFHDGFNLGENYPESYNGLAGTLAKEGTLGVSSCPNGLLGVGVVGL